jgi:hypothetical protein
VASERQKALIAKVGGFFAPANCSEEISTEHRAPAPAVQMGETSLGLNRSI